jgi:hypothetical protein
LKSRSRSPASDRVCFCFCFSRRSENRLGNTQKSDFFGRKTVLETRYWPMALTRPHRRPRRPLALLDKVLSLPERSRSPIASVGFVFVFVIVVRSKGFSASNQAKHLGLRWLTTRLRRTLNHLPNRFRRVGDLLSWCRCTSLTLFRSLQSRWRPRRPSLF